MTYFKFKRGIGRIADSLAEKIQAEGLEAAQPYNAIYASVLNAFGVMYIAKLLTRADGSRYLELFACVHLWRVKVKREVKSC